MTRTGRRLTARFPRAISTNFGQCFAFAGGRIKVGGCPRTLRPKAGEHNRFFPWHPGDADFTDTCALRPFQGAVGKDLSPGWISEAPHFRSVTPTPITEG